MKQGEKSHGKRKTSRKTARKGAKNALQLVAKRLLAEKRAHVDKLLTLKV
jgi:hypothetical protein